MGDQEHVDPKELEQELAGMDRGSLLKRLAAGGAALSIPGLIGAGSALGATGRTGASSSAYPTHPKWKFALICHATTNSFFVPTQYGAADACTLVNCSYTWSGSATASVGEMINAMNAAVTAGAAGVGVCVVDKKAFEAPINRLLKRGIPVVAFNADGAVGGTKARMAYIGQDLYASGFAMGQRIATLVPKGDVAIFIATPGALNIQPRIDGALAAIKQSGKPINAKAVPTDVDQAKEPGLVDAYYLGHKNLKGMFAVDAGDTDSVGKIIQKHSLRGKVKGGGFDLIPGTLQSIQKGFLDFTIDQQPYLQGWQPVLQLFLYKLSGGLMFPSETNTGLLFVTKANVKPYLTTKTRYEGSSSAQKYPVS